MNRLQPARARIACLDGLRGWAALFVVIGHIDLVFQFATHGDRVLPFYLDGHLAVFVFFVLSGFVLSIGFLQTSDRAVAKGLLVRRYPRLAIPVVASCLLATLLVQSGLMWNAAAGALVNSHWLLSFHAFELSLGGALRFGLWQVFVDPAAPSYNAVLWTMFYELWGSLLLLGFLLLVRGRIARRVGYGVLMLAAAWVGSPLIAFVSGAILADLFTHRPAWFDGRQPGLRRAAWAGLLLVLAAAALRMHLPHLALVAHLSPVLLAVFATVAVAAVLLDPCLQRALSTPFSRWLGALSFPLYLTHLLVICSWSSWLTIALAEAGSGWGVRVAAIGISTVALSLLVAWAFAPIERAAIRSGHWLSARIVG